MDQGLFILIDILNRIFNRNNMAVTDLVHMLDHCRKCG